MHCLVRFLAAVAIVALIGPLPARAADVPVELTLDGRPIDRQGGVAISRNGVLLADVVDLTRSFNGLLVFEGRKAVRIDLRGAVASFTVGSKVARINGKMVKLATAPFIRKGDIYVPLAPIVEMTGAKLATADRRHADLQIPMVNGSGTPAPLESGPSPAAALVLSPSALAKGDGLHVTLSVRNPTSAPYALRFPNSSRATFEVLDGGATVWNSGAGRRYAQSLGTVIVPAGGTVIFEDLWPGWNAATTGRYQLRATLMVTNPVQTSPISLGVSNPSQNIPSAAPVTTPSKP